MALFKPFAALVHAQFNLLAKGELYEANITPDELWAEYLKAFPEGTNPIYKTRTEHDCGCCRHFVRGLGNVVAIEDGKVKTIWDIKGAEAPYQEVADYLSAIVRHAGVKTIYRTVPKETKYGAEQSLQSLGGGEVKKWNHFYATVPSKFVHASPGSVRGEHEASVQVLHRGLEELAPEAFDTVLSLIDQKALYRGQEHVAAIGLFMNAQLKYKSLKTEAERQLFLHQNASNMAVSRFKNTVIGTLLEDLSSGVDLERAVASFEAKVAPQNYKRTTSLITPRMVQDAMVTLRDNGLEAAITRRHAVLSDINVNNVLWVANDSKKQMQGALESMLLDVAASNDPAPDPERAEVISIEDFMAKVAPKATSMDLWLENRHQPNFVNLLTAKDDPNARLFKWDNPFSWSYDGNVTDSIQEKVKRAGGKLDVPLRVSLEWYNYDDLDLHAHFGGDQHVYFGHKMGILDVDMNAGGGRSRTPVENLAWKTPVNGHYKIIVNQYSRRETIDVGFSVELAYGDVVQQYKYPKGVSGSVTALEFEYESGKVKNLKVGAGLTGGSLSQEKWGVTTEAYVKVNTIMHSPNFWDNNAVGHCHFFFMLDGCANPTPARGVYNEFLASGLEKHRKVFEVVGAKTLVQPTEQQLAGIGLSSTRKDTARIMVTQAQSKRLYNVVF